jgi:hypothetical protein
LLPRSIDSSFAHVVFDPKLTPKAKNSMLTIHDECVGCFWISHTGLWDVRNATIRSLDIRNFLLCSLVTALQRSTRRYQVHIASMITTKCHIQAPRR